MYVANCLWDISPVLLWWLYTNSSKFDLDANGDYHLFKVRKNGQQKTCNLSCNIAVKQVEYRCGAFYHPHRTCLATNQVVNRFERGWGRWARRNVCRSQARFVLYLEYYQTTFLSPFAQRERQQQLHFLTKIFELTLRKIVWMCMSIFHGCCLSLDEMHFTQRNIG